MMNKFLTLLLSFLILTTACGNKQASSTAGNLLTDAKTLRMYPMGDNVTVAEVVSPEDSAKTVAKYYLVKRGTEKPSVADGEVIEVPLQKAVVYTSVHASALDELGAGAIIKGVADASYFTLPSVKEGLANGSIADLGTSSAPAVEKIIDLSPDAIILNIYDGMDTRSVEKLGIPIIRMSENEEQTPLGRAEWLKLLGALTGNVEKADSIFSGVRQRYAAAMKETAGRKQRPTVFADNIYQGVWYVAGGGSYTARIYADAGATYPWADDKSAGSLNLSFEQVLDKARDADFWLLKVFGQKLTRDGLMAMDPRYKHFSAVDKGGVYYCDTSTAPIFDETPFHPDLLLREYINIFNRNDDRLRYFRPMGK